MPKKVYANEVNSEDKKIKENLNDSKNNDNKDNSDAGGASGFSDDAEKKFQQKKKRENGKITSCSK